MHTIAAHLGPAKTSALHAFHALTGCDTTSSFFGKMKKTALAVWNAVPELTVPLILLSRPNPSPEVLTTYSPVLQQFVTQLYGVCENDASTVDSARHHLFLEKGKDFAQLPPGSDAFQQHLLRVAYQSGHVWGNLLKKVSEPVSLEDWGWQQETPNSAPTPRFTTIDILSKKTPELVSCKCRAACKPPCTCKTNQKPCMLTCTCKCPKNLPV